MSIMTDMIVVGQKGMHANENNNQARQRDLMALPKVKMAVLCCEKWYTMSN